MQDDPSRPQLRQRINRSMCHSLRQVDLTSLASYDLALDRATHMFQQDYSTPFDLAHGPLIRCTLYLLPQSAALLSVVTHHIIFDGQTHFMFFKQLWEMYTIISTRSTRPLPTPPKTLYVQFAEAEHAALYQTHISPSMCTHLEYWRHKLAGLEDAAPCTLPGDKKRPPSFTHRGARMTTFIPEETILRLTRVTPNVTPFTAIVSSIFVLLYRFTGRSDCVVGTPVAGRLHSSLQDVLGCFVNSLVLRAPVDPATSFSTLVDVVSRIRDEALEHQEAPFDWLVSQLNVPRDTSTTPLFSVNVCYHNAGPSNTGSRYAPVPPGAERRLVHNDSTKWDLYFDFVHEKDSGIRFTLEYYADAFSEAYAQTVSDMLVHLLNALGEHPSTPLGQVPLPTSCLSVIHGPRIPPSRPLSIQLIEILSHASHHDPDRAIISAYQQGIQPVSGLSSYTSTELLQQLGALGTFLRYQSDLPARSRVGLLQDPTPRGVMAIIACLLSGLSFVPLDPHVPLARLERQCEQAGLRALVYSSSHSALALRLKEQLALDRSVCLDQDTPFSSVPLQPVEGDLPGLMDMDLWDMVASQAGEDDIAAGGWKNSYTGDHFTLLEMNEYVHNVHERLAPYVGTHSRVLELGAASGLTLGALAPSCASYLATDPSPATVQRLSLRTAHLPQVRVELGYADEVTARLVDQHELYDVIVINSVVHCFPNHAYLVAVLSRCTRLLSPGGVIFLGDVMDLDKRDQLVHSLHAYKQAHPSAPTKTVWIDELFLSKRFLERLAVSLSRVGGIEFYEKIATQTNELTRFRFDALLKILHTVPVTRIDEEDLHLYHGLGWHTFSDVITMAQSDNENTALYARSVTASDEAYVLYTSGTSGVPRGVTITHGALATYATWANATYRLTRDDCMALASPFTFDFTLTCIVCPLLASAKILVFGVFQESFQHISRCDELTIAKLSPLQLRLLLDCNGSSTMHPLHMDRFILGGEALSADLMDMLHTRQNGAPFQVWNEYGPTEATVGCVVKSFDSYDLPYPHTAFVPIGLPTPNTSIAIVGEDMRPVPLGGIGRLCIAGAQLSTAFLGPDRHAQFDTSFVASVCYARSGPDVMFVTDDFGSISPSTGDILYFGRVGSTSSVKVNGMRVDLLEVQGVLERSPGVTQAWARLVDCGDHAILGAAVQFRAHYNAIDRDEALHHLHEVVIQALPEHCRPKILCAVETPPMNHNGKVDTAALGQLMLASRVPRASPPGSHDALPEEDQPIVEKLRGALRASFWGLSSLPIGLDDHFMQHLCGDSIQVIRLVRHLDHKYGIALKVVDVFQAPTIRKLLPIIRLQRASPAIVLLASDVPIPLAVRPTPIVAAFLNQPLVHASRFALPALLRVRPPFSSSITPNDVLHAVQALVQRHAILRSSFAVGDEGVTMTLPPSLDGTLVDLEIVDIDGDAPLGIPSSSSPFLALSQHAMFQALCTRLEGKLDLGAGIVLVGAFIRYNQERFVFLVVHHVVVDVVSWSILIDDLEALLAPPPRPAYLSGTPRTPFHVFSTQLHGLGSLFKPEEAYWQVVVDRSNESLGIPCSRPVPVSRPTFGSAAFTMATISSLRPAPAGDEQAMLLAAFANACQALHGAAVEGQQVAVCMEGNGRARSVPIDACDTVGWLTCRYPMCVPCEPSLSSPTLHTQFNTLRRMIDDVPHGGVGFGVLQSSRDWQLPSVMFVHLGHLGHESTLAADDSMCFEHVPWIEVMMADLDKGRFHRHPDDVLEFDAEVITWRFGADIKMGVLYSRDRYSEEDVSLLLEHVRRCVATMMDDAAPIPPSPPSIVPALPHSPYTPHVQLLISMELPTECVSSIQDLVSRSSGVEVSVTSTAPDQMFQIMCTPPAGSPSPTSGVILVASWDSIASYQQLSDLLPAYIRYMEGVPVTLVDASCLRLGLSAQERQEVHSILATSVAGLSSFKVKLETFEDKTWVTHLDVHTSKMYNMPLTRAGYILLGFHLARHARSCLVPFAPYKVIAVDADDTLWRGQCANNEIAIDPCHRALQQFLLHKKDEGFLLLLVSHNERADVEIAFSSPDMILSLEDFVGVHVGWENKSTILEKALSILHLPAHVTVFLDDDPLQCSEVNLHLPSVLTILVPSPAHGADSRLAPAFPQFLWMLDQREITVDAAGRTASYQAEARRQAHRSQSPPSEAPDSSTQLDVVLASWGMHITIHEVAGAELLGNSALATRVRELLERTNQFNMNKAFGKEPLGPHHTYILIYMKDKFGSYGLISVAVVGADGYHLLQWVISCRALQRKVEDVVLRHLMQRASPHPLVLTVQKTPANTPALLFLQQCGLQVQWGTTQDTVMHGTAVCPPETIIADPMIHHVDIVHALPNELEGMTLNVSLPLVPSGGDVTANLLVYGPCLSHWVSRLWPSTLSNQQHAHHLAPMLYWSSQVTLEPHQEPNMSLRNVLETVWMDILDLTVPPRDEDVFIECGGTSSHAVFMASRLRRELHLDWSIAVLAHATFGSMLNAIRGQGATIPSTSPSSPSLTDSTSDGAHAPTSYPLTSLQLELLALQQLAPTSCAYTETVAIPCSRGVLDTQEVLQVFCALVDARPELLTTMDLMNNTGMVLQNQSNSDLIASMLHTEQVDMPLLATHLSTTCPALPLSHGNAVTHTGMLCAFKHVIVSTPSSPQSVLVLHVHHMLVDDVSLAGIESTLGDLLHRKAPLMRPPCPSGRSYADFAAAEQVYLRSPTSREDSAFWRDMFDGCSQIESSLYLDRSRKWDSTVPYAARSNTHRLGSNVVSLLDSFCCAAQCSRFACLLACYLLVLRRYSGQSDLTICIPISTRTDEDSDTCGPFINTVLMRVEMSQHRASSLSLFASYLESLIWNCRDHALYPMHNLVSERRAALGNQTLAWTGLPMMNYSSASRSHSSLRVPSKHAKSFLTLDVLCADGTQDIDVVIEWADGWVDDTMAYNLLDSYVHALGVVGHDGDSISRLNQLPTMSPTQASNLREFSRPLPIACVIDTMKDDGVLSRWHHHVAVHPNQVAVTYGARAVTYLQLDTLASNVASVLYNKLGEQLQSGPVALATLKDEWTLVGMLAVWKAGGYFMPLSPLYPMEHITASLERSEACAILTNMDGPTLFTSTMPDISFDIRIIASVSSHPSLLPQMSSRHAYAITTSGSTGTPKLLKVPHEGLSCIVRAWCEAYSVRDGGARVLQWAQFTFDVFIGDVMRALVCAPGCLIICPTEDRLNFESIISLIHQHHITMVEFTPHFTLQLVEYASRVGSLSLLSSLHMVIMGSDINKPYMYHKVRALLPGRRVLNSYGMTEATIDSAYFEGPIVDSSSDMLPIGRPLPGVALFILDLEQGVEEVPIGTIGELCISGPVIAEGDVRTSELSLGSQAVRVLHTGDSARWLPSGDVELLGRLDDTLKIRGIRIATGELENKLRTCAPGVRDAYATVLRQEATGQEFLCCFIVPDQEGEGLSRASLRSSLSSLPSHMHPDAYYAINMLPLSVNGKINRSCLPSAETVLLDQIVDPSSGPCNNAPPAVPHPIQDRLCNLLADILGVMPSHIDRRRKFMEQGAHSMVLTRFHLLITQCLGQPFHIANLFEHDSIELLASYIISGMDVAGSSQPLESEVPAEEEVAIVGVGMRLPGAIASMHQLWAALGSKHDLFKEFPDQRGLDVLDHAPAQLRDEIHRSGTFQGAFLNDIDLFDSGAFNIVESEANIMPPEQRMILMVAAEALVDASVSLKHAAGRNIGVFMGATDIGYSKLSLDRADPSNIPSELPSMVGTRVAYQFDLKGPCMTVETTCSSSAVALLSAVESVRAGKCEAAIVGGVSIVLYPSKVGVHGSSAIQSHDSRCRPFDQDSKGTAVGEGAICLVVKPVSAALRDGNSIYAVVKGGATNSVGRGASITAPTASSQVAVIRAAHQNAGVAASDVSYVETHGTGTLIGDQIELSALSTVFTEEVLLGVGKANFGHLDSAAGLLGVLKVLASLQYGTVPAHPTLRTPHSQLTTSRLTLPRTPTSWPTSRNPRSPRTAGVSSFGLSGTNCHIVLQEHVRSRTPSQTTGDDDTILLCGQDLAHYQGQASDLLCYIESVRDQALPHGSLCSSISRRAILTYEFSTCARTNPTRSVLMMRSRDMASTTSLLQQLSVAASLESFVSQHPLATSIIHNHDALHQLINQHVGQGVGPHIGVPMSLFANSRRHWLTEKVTHTTPSSDSLGAYSLQNMLTQRMFAVQELVHTLNLSPPPLLVQALDDFCTALIVSFVRGTAWGARFTPGSQHTFDQAFADTRMHRRYRKLFYVMLRHLAQHHVIAPAEGVPFLTGSFDILAVPELDASKIAEHAQTLYPAYADCFRFPLHCSGSYQEVLVGNMSPLNVIYPKADLTFMYQFNKLGDQLGDVYYNMYMQLIAEHVRSLLAQGRPVRILEVGAGMGHVTRQLVPKLHTMQGDMEYWFTDLGQDFVDNAKAMFGQYAGIMRYAKFDITKPGPAQGLFGAFDLIISYNVIHTTESVRASVSNLKASLGPEGNLFVIESARNETWSTLAWGLLDGWWFFKDTDLRPHDPMLDPDTWEAVLKQEGFADAYVCPQDPRERDHVEKFLFICPNTVYHYRGAAPPSNTAPHRWWRQSETGDIATPVSAEPLATDFQQGLVTNGPMSAPSVLDELQRIWSRLLYGDESKAATMDIDAPFNELGGDSLRTVKMIQMVKTRLGVQLELADAFGYSTLDSLSQLICERLSLPHARPEPYEAVSSVTLRLPCPSNKPSEAHMLMFPGQGVQCKGMVASMEHSEAAMKVFNEAHNILGFDIFAACVEGRQEDFTSTAFVQTALFVCSVAKASQLSDERPELMQQVSHVAGMSVGEFAALVIAGVVSFCDGLKLVRRRGELMDLDAKRADTAMFTVFGPSAHQLEDFLSSRYPDLCVSGYLTETQHTVAGPRAACKGAAALLEGEARKDLHVESCIFLQVAGAFHSPYMQAASNAWIPLLNEMPFATARIPLITNYSGTLSCDPEFIRGEVAKQLVAPVRWCAVLATAVRAGVRNFVEVSPKRVLSAIVTDRMALCMERRCKATWIKTGR
eukprot:TRINITY_DN9446_c0_g1_i2.p1 TRINITY_DN9446_c0_g1~~TRINITY_DN9446_c0_g1_i2.p1  ORF type:complete len:5053 (-),score=624.11 TRINITY_DN9446_c0_g1_i2:50-15208(-)